MVMWPWPCESQARNAFPNSEGTHTRWKGCPSFSCLFIWIFVVFWHQSTLCKVINQAVNSVNSDLPAFSSVQATSLWRVSYHRRTKSLSEKSGTRERKPALWHVHVPILAGLQNGRISGRKNTHIILKNKLLRVNFQDEGQLYANFLIFILTIYR